MIALSIRRLPRSDYACSVFIVSLFTAPRNGSYGQLPKCSGFGRRSFASVTGSLESSLAPEKDELAILKDSLKTRSQNYHCSVYTNIPNTFVRIILLPISPLAELHRKHDTNKSRTQPNSNFLLSDSPPHCKRLPKLYCW